MAVPLTRFYYDFYEKLPANQSNIAYEDIERKDADAFEKGLKTKKIPYTRIDL